jgi:non-specific serine/threonine protein kinase
VEESLVEFDEREGDARYRLLETVRQYGQKKLAEAGETTALRRRHRDFFLALVERGEPELRGAGQGTWFARFEAEQDNLRAALEWSGTDEGGAEPGLRLAAGLYWFWHTRGYWSEAREWLERALARSGEAPVACLPKAIHGMAVIMRRLGEYERAVPLCEKGLALCRELGDKRYGPWFLIQFGLGALNHGDYARAKALCEDALAMCRESGDKWFIALGLNHLGEVALRQGDYSHAATLYTESLALVRELGDKVAMAYNSRYLGEIAVRQGNYTQAAAFCTEGLTLAIETRSNSETAGGIEGLAQLACAKGNYAQAGRLFGMAEKLRETLGFRHERNDRTHHDQGVASTRAVLGEVALAAAWAEGRAMTLEQAIEYALVPDCQWHRRQ